jgi:probable F420-dependent oxidoreductase
MSTPQAVEMGVVVAGREDERPPTEALGLAALADELGYRHLWVGESGPTWDGFVLATAIGQTTRRIEMTVGPLPVAVRDPATILRAASSVATTLTGRPVGVALGTSSTRVVEGIHHRSRAHAATVLAETAEAIASGLDDPDDEYLRRQGFRRRLSPPGGPLTIAAFGDRAITVAARHADRMLLDLVPPEQVTRLRAKLDAAAQQAGRQPPRLAAWLPAAIDPDEAAYRQILGSIAAYLTVRGYAEMFTFAGYGHAVELAHAGADPTQVIEPSGGRQPTQSGWSATSRPSTPACRPMPPRVLTRSPSCPPPPATSTANTPSPHSHQAQEHKA